MKTLSVLLLMTIGFSLPSFGADSAKSEIVGMFLTNISNAHFVPAAEGHPIPAKSVAEVFADVLMKGNNVSAHCESIGKSMLKDCTIVIQEGGGEGFGSSHVFQFETAPGVGIVNGAVRYVIGV